MECASIAHLHSNVRYRLCVIHFSITAKTLCAHVCVCVKMCVCVCVCVRVCVNPKPYACMHAIHCCKGNVCTHTLVFQVCMHAIHCCKGNVCTHTGFPGYMCVSTSGKRYHVRAAVHLSVCERERERESVCIKSFECDEKRRAGARTCVNVFHPSAYRE